MMQGFVMPRRLRRTRIACWVASTFVASAALANPIGPTVAGGSAAFSSTGKSPTVTTAPGSILNWQSFSIGPGELTRFFLDGRLRFEGGGLGMLRNEAAIRSTGDIFLVGPKIENAGLIRSDAGSVLLAAGQSVTITSPDAQGVQFALRAPADSAVNLGRIEAKNAAAMFAGTPRHSGDIRANRVALSAILDSSDVL